ncbi:MAG: hypothetical protein U5O15_05990 [Candidatus Krumholzibacteriota bacterium]|nr:hypothetical protein [Candidatus Krumholzibacteriota bacterium]
MQNREKVCGGKERQIILIIILYYIINIPVPVSAGAAVWTKARSGAVHPGIVPNLNCLRTDCNHIGLISSVSNPYSIKGLTDSFLLTGIHNGSNDLWISWSLLNHDLYREDRVRIRWIRRIARCGIKLGLAPGFRGKRVAGFNYETEKTIGVSASYNWRNLLGLGVKGNLHNFDCYDNEKVKFMVSISDPPISLLFNYVVLRRNDDNFLIGLEVNLSCNFCILSGYDENTNEISTGLVYRRNYWYFGVTWNNHPVLGSTISAGVGVLWAG